MKLKYKIVNCLIYCLALIMSLGFFVDTAYCEANDLYDKANLEAFFDHFFEENMTQSNIPGATLVVVQNGDVALEKGYGYYDLENKREVDPRKTIFPLESATKVITAMATMQLVEKGTLDLDENINNYITKFQINNSYDSPVTLHNLLTHTSGLDDTDIEMYVKNKEQLPSLEEYLSERLPDIIMEPGEVISYGNHGFALVGYLIEKATHMSFDKYIDKNLIAPLNMDRSRFFVEDDFANDIAINYVYSNGEYQKGSSYYHLYSPAGLFKSTASDMGKFIISLLNRGEYQGQTILKEETVDRVFNTQFTQHPDLEGWTYGFYEHFLNGKRVLTHGGDSNFGYSSKVFLIPEENIGVFVATNTYAHDFCDDLLRDFIDEYYPQKSNSVLDTDHIGENLNKFTGNYIYNRYDRNSFLKIGILSNQLKVSEEDGYLIIDNHIDTDFPRKWVQVEPLVFINHDKYIVFNENNNKVDYLFSGRDLNYEKLSWYEYDIINVLFVGLAFIIFLITILTTSIRIFRNKETSRFIQRLRFMILIISIINLCFLVGFALYMMSGTMINIVFNVPAVLKLLFALPILSTVATIVLFMFNLKYWCHEEYNLSEKVYNTCVMLLSMIFILFLLNWNLLGFNF